MKKNYLVLGLMLTATLTLTNCAKEQTVNEPEQNGVPFELIAGIDTKTSTADGTTINWVADDALNVFHAVAGSTTYSKNDKFTFNTGTNFTGTLQDGALTEDAYDWYALYPYYAGTPSPENTTTGYTTIYSNQTQAGYDSKAHLAGKGLPLHGKVTNVAKDTKPSIAMKQVCSVVKIKITNKTASPVHISSVAFTAPENITGNYFINFAGETASFTEKTGGVSKTATLSVSGDETLAADGSACFYLAIKPFTASSGDLKVVMNDECTKTFTLTSATTFAEGKIKTLNVNYTGPDVIAPETLPYDNTLISGHEGFTINNVKSGSLDAVWKDSSYGITANANGTTSDMEGYLVSPVFDLTAETAAFLYFDHNIRYFKDLATAKVQATMQVKADEGDWTAVEIPDYSSNSDNNFTSTSVDLSAYCGHLLQIRFKFLATTDPSSKGRWEIKNFSFKKTVVKTLEVSPASLNWAAAETDAKNVTVTLNDGASGYTVTPATDANWTITDNGSGTITVAPKAVNESTTDAKTLTLTITHKDDGELTKTVTCTQAKATAAGSFEVTVVIETYATANSWVNGTQYSSANIDSNITATITGGSNSGKYYTSGQQWRTYQNENPTITISGAAGITIDSVAITYANKNNGVLKNGDAAVASAEEVTVNANSITFTVGNTGDATNGQVNITQIYVKYHS